MWNKYFNSIQKDVANLGETIEDEISIEEKYSEKSKDENK